MSKSTRKIKCLGECVDKGEIFLHPITLAMIHNDSKDKKYCASEFHYNNNKPRYGTICDDKTKIDIRKFMALPYVNLNIDQMLKIFKINDIDSLLSWVDIQIENELPFQYINRIINIWIRQNYDLLKKNNDILVSLYLRQFSELSDNEIKTFLKKWFKTKKQDDFTFNLGLDMYNNFHK